MYISFCLYTSYLGQSIRVWNICCFFLYIICQFSEKSVRICYNRIIIRNMEEYIIWWTTIRRLVYSVPTAFIQRSEPSKPFEHPNLTQQCITVQCITVQHSTAGGGGGGTASDSHKSPRFTVVPHSSGSNIPPLRWHF